MKALLGWDHVYQDLIDWNDPGPGWASWEAGCCGSTSLPMFASGISAQTGSPLYY